MFNWSAIVGLYKRAITWPSRYPLTVRSGFSLAFLLFFAVIPLYLLVSASLDKERSIRRELYARDLREIAGRYDSDERFVLWKNLDHFLSARRPLSPLLLPRQYYAALPSRASLGPPRPPPKNCFVDLMPSGDGREGQTPEYPDRFCAYFTTDKTLGTYLFFAISFVDNDIVPHNIGDSSLSADSLDVLLTQGQLRASWTITLQEPKVKTLPGRYQITAYMNMEGGRRERDKRFEGWAYTQTQEANKLQVVNLIARLDYKAIQANGPKSLPDDWPPRDIRNITFSLSRKNVTHQNLKAKSLPYAPMGVSNLSLPSLYSSLGRTRALLLVKQKADSKVINEWSISSQDGAAKTESTPSFFPRTDGGDLIFGRWNPIRREQALPDTDLWFEIVHPGTVIERSVWEAVGLLVVLLIGFFYFAAKFIIRVMGPINRMAKWSLMISLERANSTTILPFSDTQNEIGTLSRAFNDLLAQTRDSAKREHEERAKREEAERRRHNEEMRARETSLKTIGHEIRSPLQALLAIHAQGSVGRHYAERMMKALENLYGAAGPEEGFSSIPLQLERQDVAKFIADVAANAHLAGIEDVNYSGPTGGVYCRFDDDALEQAMEHILDNAKRLRRASSEIEISLAVINSEVVVGIKNQGPTIEEEMLERIFEMGVSLDEQHVGVGSGQGLYVVRSYVGRMGGNVTARNWADGVVIEIRLPVAVA